VVLVDTSVWIEVFKKRQPLDLEKVISFDEIVTCLPVVQEVLQGFRDEGVFRGAREAMLALPIVESPLTEEAFLDAIDLYRRARQTGVTVRSSVDCLISTCAIRHNLVVLHKDRDFKSLAKISSLREKTI
jgi:predicted nucleic acid-binding protein